MISDHDVLGEPEAVHGRGMTLLRGVEIGTAGAHVLHVGAASKLSCDRHQTLLDAVAADSGFAILCHPNWGDSFTHYTFETMLALNGYAGIEVFNGVVMDLTGSHLATDKWDRLLSAGKRIWGFANDDAHRPHQIGRGWNVVRARQHTAEAIIEALRAGSFYASCGVRIDAIECDGPVVRVRSADADRIDVYGLYGRRVGWADGGNLTFDATDVDGPYIRVECLGRGGRAAWTQPMFIRRG
jgi:hypothetical protein